MSITASVDTTIQLIARGELDGETCTPDLVEAPWEFDRRRRRYGPGASMADPIPAAAPLQGELPEEYRTASADELRERILAAKATLGDRVVMLGHFYQRDEVVQYADFVGDSFQLANAAKAKPEAEAIVFCGVHFMAETADILSRPEQAVILPNLAAGCSMADMADIDSVTECWEQLEELYGTEPDADGRVPVIPVTYMNSSAALKGFCGEHGGIVCTSSNAETVLTWAFERGQRVLFFPDQHLGRNTAKAMGVPLEQMPLWNPRKALGGNDAETLSDARVILWHGFCSVHKRFTVGQIEQARVEHPGCARDRAPGVPDAGRRRGRRVRLDRLHRQGDRRPRPPGRRSRSAPRSTSCSGSRPSTRSTRSSASTRWSARARRCTASTPATSPGCSKAWCAARSCNRITVPDDVAEPARVALERMLAATPDTTMAA